MSQPLLDTLAAFKNLAVVNITQCSQVMVEMGLYDASAGLLKRGIISGVDMTPEATMTKMMFLLGQYPEDVGSVKELMQKNLRGEQSVNVYNFVSDQGSADLVHKTPARQIPSALFRRISFRQTSGWTVPASLPPPIGERWPARSS